MRTSECQKKKKKKSTTSHDQAIKSDLARLAAGDGGSAGNGWLYDEKASKLTVEM